MGRETDARSRLAGEFGGSKQSEQAVELGLRWLINHQQSDGSWRLQHNRGECDGRCANPGTRESTTAATGLALMALLGAGYTHEVGPYQSEINAGLDYLKSRMRRESLWGQPRRRFDVCPGDCHHRLERGLYPDARRRTEGNR